MTPQDLRRARDGAFDRDYVRPTSGYGAHSFWIFSYLSYALVHTHSQVTHFYLHHTRMISKAAVVRDATMIREQVQCLRQRVCSADAGAGGVP